MYIANCARKGAFLWVTGGGWYCLRVRLSASIGHPTIPLEYIACAAPITDSQVGSPSLITGSNPALIGSTKLKESPISMSGTARMIKELRSRVVGAVKRINSVIAGAGKTDMRWLVDPKLNRKIIPSRYRSLPRSSFLSFQRIASQVTQAMTSTLIV